MTQTGQNVEIYQGKDRTLTILVLDAVNSAFNVAGCSFRYVVYKPTTGQIVINKTTPSGSGISIVNEAGGELEIKLTPVDTAALLGTYNHECGITTADGLEDVVFTGQFKVFASKT